MLAIRELVRNRRKTVAWVFAVALTSLNATKEVSAMQSPENTASVRPRRLVLCLDGTWNSAYDEKQRSDGHTVLKPSNPLKACRAVLPFDEATGQVQVAYYHIGIGSLAEYPGVPNRLLYFSDRVLGGIWGAGFEENIEETLHFLVLNHREGDELFVFGFSRGAATARAVTQFIEWNEGLPQKEDAYFLPMLFRAYVISHGASDARAAAIDQINADLRRDEKEPLRPFQAVRVAYLGVWDTVMAIGSRFAATGKSTSEAGWTFYAGTAPATCVAHARQALAVDEARYDFRPEIWTHHHVGQRMEQRWFPGVHSNVGGGYVKDGLANIAFHWILEGAMEEGLRIDTKYAAFFRPFPLASLYRSSSVLYRVIEALRFRSGRGRRQLVGMPAEANLDIDKSVIHRIRADPKSLQQGSDPTLRRYRPENVLLFLACQPDLDDYLNKIGIDDLATHPLPKDVQRRINQLRPRRTRVTSAK